MSVSEEQPADSWSTTICSDCCVGPAPEPWKENPEMWVDGATGTCGPAGCCWLACPCAPAADVFETLGLLEEGWGCTPSNKTCCCWTFGICCILQNAGLPVLPLYMARMRMKAAEKMGLKQDSWCFNFWMGCAAGLVVNQVSRELILHGLDKRAKPRPVEIADCC